jgi:glycerophosphoryl diester phosphodiesterase
MKLRIGRKWRIALVAFAAVAVTLSLMNASWMAPSPKGRLILVAHRGIAQQFDRKGLDRDTCTATRIKPLEHNYIENTVRSINDSVGYGANMVELDVAPTKDGQMVVFHDWTLDCRTNGHGPVRDHTLAELKALDVGYGYTADGGKTFPLRGRGVGLMPTVEEVLHAVPRVKLLFNFKSKEPAEADMLLAAFRRAGVVPDERYGFYGHIGPVARMRQLAPKAWNWTKEEAKACAVDYLKWGWSSFVPKSCRDGTVMVPLNYQWAVWGWPDRFLDRMAGSNTKVVVIGDVVKGRSPGGLERAEQLGEVPQSFKGYLWVEDIYEVGRSLLR